MKGRTSVIPLKANVVSTSPLAEKYKFWDEFFVQESKQDTPKKVEKFMFRRVLQPNSNTAEQRLEAVSPRSCRASDLNKSKSKIASLLVRVASESSDLAFSADEKSDRPLSYFISPSTSS